MAVAHNFRHREVAGRNYWNSSSQRLDENDAERSVRIVGIDEARTEKGEISWVSPIARALLRAELGDRE